MILLLLLCHIMHAIPKSLSRKDCIHVSDFKYELDGSFWLAFVARRQMGPIFSTQETTITSLFIENRSPLCGLTIRGLRKNQIVV